MKFRPELLAPAGDLNIAIKALMAGADAVYLGLRDFSARKNAGNFDLDDLRRLHHFALNSNKKVYVAINTIIKNNEIPSVLEILMRLDFMEIGGIIIQDLGLLHLIRKHFPRLHIHSSTQMAINSPEGVKMAGQLGIQRVILPRETTLVEMKSMREQCPEVELEAFIHGALCYSFSGMCLISGLLLNRSGNRGECAQICRNYFKTQQGMLYPFSCNDLFLSRKIKELQEIGIASLKIEGRLKKAEYVVAVVKLYRYIIDNEKHDSKKIEELEQTVFQVFSRHRTDAYLHDSKGGDLINPYYSKNVGKHLGKIKRVTGKNIEIDCAHVPIYKGDELLVLKNGFNQQASKIVVTKVQDKKIEVYSTEDAKNNDNIYLFNRGNSNDAMIIDRLTLWKKNLLINLMGDANRIEVSCKLYGKTISGKIDNQLLDRHGDGSLLDAFKSAFLKTDKSWFVGVVQSESQNLENKFLPLSAIKELKNILWKKVDEMLEKKIQMELSMTDLSLQDISHFAKDHFFARRSNLSIQNKQQTPFAHPGDFNDLTKFAKYDEEIYIPLHPLLSTSAYFESLKILIATNHDREFVVGLNNLSHLYWAEKNEFKNVSYWIDYYLYVASNATLNFMLSLLPSNRIRFAYNWIEDETSCLNLITITDRMKIPCMISKGCVKKNVFNSASECSRCNGSFSYLLDNNLSHFMVYAKDCINYICLAGGKEKDL